MSLPTPNTRKEQYLNAIATGNSGGLPTPITREEEYLDAIAKSGGGGGGTTNYNALDNKPQIAGTTLQGNKSLADLGIAGEGAIDDVYAVMGEMGAKQLIPYPYYETTKTQNGVTFTDNGDGSVTVVTTAGGATNHSRFYLKQTTDDFCFKKGKTYVLTDKVADGGSSNYKTEVALYNGSTYIGTAFSTVNGSVEFTLPNNDTYDRVSMYITVYKNQVITTPITFKPMIRLASDTDNTYQQYAKTNKQLTDEIANKVDKVAGKGLSTNDYDNTEKGKVADNTAAIEAMVNVNGCCNVLDLSDPSIVSDGVTFTVNSDGSVTANGTAVTNSFIAFKNTATARDMVVVGASGGVHIIAMPYGHSWEEVDEGIIHGINQNGFALQVDAGVTVNNVTVYPMLYDAHLNPTGYVPYSMTNKQLTDRIIQQDIPINVEIPAKGYNYVDVTPPTGYKPFAVNTLYNSLALFAQPNHFGNQARISLFNALDNTVTYENDIRVWFIKS